MGVVPLGQIDFGVHQFAARPTAVRVFTFLVNFTIVIRFLPAVAANGIDNAVFGVVDLVVGDIFLGFARLHIDAGAVFIVDGFHNGNSVFGASLVVGHIACGKPQFVAVDEGRNVGIHGIDARIQVNNFHWCRVAFLLCRPFAVVQFTIGTVEINGGIDGIGVDKFLVVHQCRPVVFESFIHIAEQKIGHLINAGALHLGNVGEQITRGCVAAHVVSTVPAEEFCVDTVAVDFEQNVVISEGLRPLLRVVRLGRFFLVLL